MTPKVPDYGHYEADKELTALIRRLHLSYRQARINLQEKIEDYLDQFEKKDFLMRALYDSGELSHEDYMKWKYSTLAGTKQWKNMLNQLADDLTHQNEIAASMIDDTLPGVYALNHNYGTFEAEKGSGFDTTYTMYDKNTVKRLLTEHEDLLPKPSVDIPKDLLWNRQHLQSALLQGILTGDSMADIAKRFQAVTDMTERAAMRNARTAVTGAENAGRIDSYKRAEKMGIKMQQMWMATLDSRTRDSHAIMDGEQQEVGKKFSNGCRYPGDPQGAPAEVYNCRCSAVAVVEGADPYNPNLRKSSYLEDEGLTYDEWKKMHGERFYNKLFKDEKEVQKNSAFSEITTIEEAKKHLSSIFGSVEDKLWKNDNDLMIRNTNQLMKLNERFGALTSGNRGFITSSPWGKAIAWTNSRYRKDIEDVDLSLVDSFYKKSKKLKEEFEKSISRFFNMPSADENWDVYAVTHEYGHILESFISRKREDWNAIEEKISKIDPKRFDLIRKVYENAEKNQAKEIYNEIIDIAKKNNPDFVLNDNLSRYGRTNHYEAFAEMFANSQCGKPNELGIAMQEWLKKQGF